VAAKILRMRKIFDGVPEWVEFLAVGAVAAVILGGGILAVWLMR
jgi:hypothetical protein